MAKKTSKKAAEAVAPAETPVETPEEVETRVKAVQSGADGGSVVVCSKLGRDHQITTPHGKVILHGSNSAIIIGGYGKTVVPRKQWEYIERIYGKTAAFENGIIFAADTDAYANDKAKEMAGVKTGAESLKPGEIMSGK